MPQLDKRLLKFAITIAERITTAQAAEPLLDLPTSLWESSARLVRQIRRAQLRGWHLAARQLRTDLRYMLGALEAELATLHGRLPAVTAVAPLLRTRDIYHDLVALEEDFAGLDFDRGHLSVTTEPIELAGVYLGPFAVRLELSRLAASDAPYRVVASDPHPPESRANVTHPHVMDEVLCEGDGRQAIRQALAQGRLLDFFTLIAGVLRNYNRESPFVELALWYGHSCSDCGAAVDDYYSCHRCGEVMCAECEIMCQACENSCCSACSASCPACESNYCRRCLKRCDACRENFCSECLDLHERCPHCHEDQEPQAEPEFAPAAVARAAVQPHGLGQARLPA